MIDRFGRRITYLRVSLTNRCQLDCSYCTLQAEPAEVLRSEEIERILRVAAERLGFRKVRLTGGEPTLRKDLPDVIARVRALEGIREVALTTNGMLLERRAAELAAAGLRTVNVSLDSLDPERFRTLTGGADVAQVVAGIRAAREAGIPRVKVNVVLMGGVNDDELEALIDFAAAERVEVRFIEHMPMDAERVGRWHVDPRDVVRRLASERQVVPLPARKDGGPAERFQVGEAVIGFIHAMSNPFCDRCNRLRITSEGTIRSCLLSGGEVDLKAAIRRGGDPSAIDDELEALIREAADAKPPIYDLHSTGGIAMRSIGG